MEHVFTNHWWIHMEQKAKQRKKLTTIGTFNGEFIGIFSVHSYSVMGLSGSTSLIYHFAVSFVAISEGKLAQ